MNMRQDDDGFLYRLRIETGSAYGEIVQEEISALNVDSAAWEDVDRAIALVDVYFNALSEAEEFRAMLEPILGTREEMGEWRIVVEKIEKEDWQESWKKHFVTERISDRIVVKPSWEAYDAQVDDCVIELDPGMSFGTGNHPTTRACLRFIDKIAAGSVNRTFLDLGCGSGILSIAAVKLGCTDVTALDIDPLAVEIACENAAINGVEQRIDFSVSDLAEVAGDRQYDLVAANILLDTLRSNSLQVSRLVKQDGILLLAGILTAQYPDIAAVYAGHGFRECESATENEWTSGWFER